MSVSKKFGDTQGAEPLIRFAPELGWIMGPTEDLVLFLGTPLLLIAAFAIAERYWSLTALGLFSTVLAMGHYLPGFMRAYGDPALFRRYRWRFVLAPLFFISLAVVMTRVESQVFLLVVVLWGAWHWLMQTYGLVRIYDAKSKNFDSATARLDYALCLAWFGVLYWQTDGAAGALVHYYRAGGQLPPELIRAVAVLWMAATVVISLLYVTHMVRRARAGHPPSPLKLTLLVVSFLFYGYAFGYSSSKLIAFGLFEGYHDIQYLAIVWVFNRNRAAKDSAAGPFTQFLFRRRAPLVLLYVALCLVFGSYDFVARSLDEQRVAQTALAIITGLALIHFYFDGFIWRIREPETRTTLGVAGVATVGKKVSVTTRSIRHGLLWAALLIPLSALSLWEMTGGARSDGDTCRIVLEVLPRSHKTHYLLASLLASQDNQGEALAHIQQARSLRPDYDLYDVLYADLMLGNDDLSMAQLDELIECYQRAEKTRSDVPNLHRNWARALRQRGLLAASAARYQVALVLDPTDAETHYQFATVLANQGQYSASAAECEHACRLDSQHADAHALLASLQMALGDTADALSHYRTSLHLQPDNARVRIQLALALSTASDATLRDTTLALQLAEQARPAAQRDASLLRDLATVYTACRRPNDAMAMTRQADQLDRESGRQDQQKGPLVHSDSRARAVTSTQRVFAPRDSDP
jgi:tetratricopeptide (TPR) repeat protein